jgi:murein DD-endopeptidase MepM/ murein hydrolase activator NlpD
MGAATMGMASAGRRGGIADLGHEPPIQLGGAAPDAQERARAPWRWVVGVTLSGLCGLALIGSALYLDLDRQSYFAALPEFATAQRAEEAGGEHVNEGKGDRLVRPVDIVAAKQDFSITQPIKIGDREILKARPYTMLSTTLTTTPTQFAGQVPPFDPLKTGADHPGKAQPDVAPPQDDTEVGFTSRDLAPADIAAVAGELPLAQAAAQVDEFVRNEQAGERRFAMAPQLMLMRTSRAGVDPLGALAYAPSGDIAPAPTFPTLAVRMVAENVTNTPRTVEGGVAAATERLIRPKHGQPFDEVLRENGASPQAAAAIVAAFGARNGESPVADGQKVILQFSDAQDPDFGRRIARVEIYADDKLRAAVAVKDDGQYLFIGAPPGDSARRAAPSDAQGGLSLYQSLYQTALKQGLPKPVIEDFVHAFANDVDFQRAAAPGDAMTAFVADADDYDPHATLLFAAMTVRDQTFRYYRFRTPDDNAIDFYDENGRSTRKFLIRKPIADGEMTSGFGMRYHPILHFSRMHTGVDWAAPIGTPILAAGNGVVIKAGWDSGYGRRVEIQHANGYVTTYNHMSGFGRGIAEGVHVTQGQVVGFLGQTGLATGPHLHYEVIINGNFVDPMAIKLARTREFDGRMLGLFKKERERIDGLMAQAPGAAIAPPGPTAKLN